MSQPSLGSMLSNEDKTILGQALNLLLAMRTHIPAESRPGADDIQDLLDRVGEPAQDPTPQPATNPHPQPGARAHLHSTADGVSHSFTGDVTGTLIQAGRINGNVNMRGM